MKIKIFASLFVVFFLLSCGNTGRVLPSATGARFELLIVMDDAEWKRPVGEELFNLFDQPMEALPQPEPMMKISHVNRAQFSDILKPSRNIIYTDISEERYTQGKITYSRDYYAYPQAFVRITAPNEEAFMNALKDHGQDIVEYFIKSERDRIMVFHKKDLNNTAVREVREMFNIEVDIPVDLKRATKADHFYWITNDNAYTNLNLVIYSYPYTDPNTFTYEFLTAKRDSVMKHHVPGEYEGSYMGTEYKYAKPIMRTISMNGEYTLEIKGLWKMIDGAAMGGPYYSITRLDEVNQMVITVEGFVFAPATNKRNPIRTLQAVVHSTRLPQDINRLEEVNITPSEEKIEVSE